VNTAVLDAGAAQERQLPTGRYARIDVSDTGEGMSHDVAARAFEPFFTTKETGRGTGLGLSMVYGIAKRCSGMAFISSTLGAGTTVTLFIPLSRDEPVSDTGDPGAVKPQVARGSVLLVDDQEGVRRSTTRILESAGYDVMSAQDAVAALDLYADSHIDILVTDVIMPRMSGRDLADRLRTHRPDLPVVFISGYSAEIISERGNLPPSTVLVVKPFSPKEILNAISDAVFDARNPVPAQ
jgi:two-component system cell cycle sensor histidine kinase/response regulator CckA